MQITWIYRSYIGTVFFVNIKVYFTGIILQRIDVILLMTLVLLQLQSRTHRFLNCNFLTVWTEVTRQPGHPPRHHFQRRHKIGLLAGVGLHFFVHLFFKINLINHFPLLSIQTLYFNHGRLHLSLILHEVSTT